MVTKYGMSEKVGNISIDYEDDGRSLSSETRSAVEEEVCAVCLPVAYWIIGRAWCIGLLAVQPLYNLCASDCTST